MDDPQALPRQIQQALARGETVVTANQRAARGLRHAFDLYQRAQGMANWEPPAVLAWDAWLGSLWRRLLLDGHASELLLNPAQEHRMWQAVIAADPATASLRPVDALAQTAAEAWLLLHSHRGRRGLHGAVGTAGTADTRAFERWAGEFERRSARLRCLTRAELPEALRAAISEGTLSPLPTGLLLVGFDRTSPTQSALLEVLRGAGVRVEEFSQASTAADAMLVRAADERTELAACARWLRARLTAQPNARLAVIHPAIESARAGIDRVFREVLAPEANDTAAPAAAGPYEFSLGVALARTPIVGAALDVLRWAEGALPIDRVSALLLSPHFAGGDLGSGDAAAGADDESLARAELDAFVLCRQRLLRPEFSVDDLYRLVSGSRWRGALGALAFRLRGLRSLLNRKDFASGERTHAEWSAFFQDLLDAAGWARGGRESSIEFQTRRKWESALDELATLDFDGVRVDFKAARVALERIAAETLFAPESRLAPVQILGPLESAGSAFDAIWFLRAGDLSWPTTPAPNPLLPWHLQRELGMPGVSPGLDTAYARDIAERIAASAPTVLFSYAQETDDGHQNPSPALANLLLDPCDAVGIVPAGPDAEAVNGLPVPLQSVVDDAAVPPPSGLVLRGGAAILRAQAQCGFRAFAERRLFSSAIDTISLGLDPMERGSLVHDVLERFWAKVETQAALKEMDPPQRAALLGRSIDDALAEISARAAAGWPRAYLDTERRRLVHLLGPWLQYEAEERAPFVVKSREEELAGVEIGPLRLDIRVDRVDQVWCGEAGSGPAGEVIFDYKTGNAKPADWLGERPDAPQLPLYAVVSGSPQLAGVAFASVRRGKDMGIDGYEAREGILPKSTRLKTASFGAQVEGWRRVLTALAEDFHSGVAAVSPKRYPQTCNTCEQRLLCRLDVSTLEADALEELEEMGEDFDSPDAASSYAEAEFD